MRRIATIFLVLFVAACQHAVHSKNIASPIPNERGEAHFEELSPGVWSHATYMEMERWGAVLSHGLIVLRGDHSILIDSGWTDTQTDDIMDWAEQDLGKPIAKAVFTHGHQDKMGGVGAVRARGIPTFAHPIANSNAPWHGLTPAETDLPFNDPGDSIEIEGLDVFFPGAAHAAGNIVIYEPDSGLLFGGCMIRPLESKSMGNIADGDLDEWPKSIMRVQDRYPETKSVLPSHSKLTAPNVLEHTKQLAIAALLNPGD